MSEEVAVDEAPMFDIRNDMPEAVEGSVQHYSIAVPSKYYGDGLRVKMVEGLKYLTMTPVARRKKKTVPSLKAGLIGNVEFGYDHESGIAKLKWNGGRIVLMISYSR